MITSEMLLKSFWEGFQPVLPYILFALVAGTVFTIIKAIIKAIIKKRK